MNGKCGVSELCYENIEEMTLTEHSRTSESADNCPNRGVSMNSNSRRLNNTRPSSPWTKVFPSDRSI